MSTAHEKRKALDYDFIRETITSIGALRWRDFFAYMYASGARVNEALDARKSDIKEQDGWIMITLRTEKNLREYDRVFPIDTHSEPWLASIIQEITFKAKDFQNDAFLFKFSDRTALRYCQKYFGCDNHTFRHSRATHYSKMYRMDSFELMRLFGWSSPKPAVIYVHKNIQDIQEKMRNAKPLGAEGLNTSFDGK